MDKREFAIFADAIKTYFPKEKNLLPNNRAMELWFDQLCDIPYNVAQIALKKWVAVSEWSPTIADIRKGAIEVTGKAVEDWGKAWENVLDAIRTYGSYDPIKGLDSLPKIAREAAKRIGWTNLCMSEDMTADRANFRMIYEELAAKEEKTIQLPPALREVIGKMQANNQIAKGEDDGGTDEHRRLYRPQESDTGGTA